METTRRKKKTIKEFCSELDAGSCRMLTFLQKHKHAPLAMLTEILGESCQMNTLVRIKKTINPKAVKFLKRPVLIFEKSRIDRDSGKNILFSWWLADEQEQEKDAEEQFADVFDEEDEVLIIIDTKGGRHENIRFEITSEKTDILYVDTNGCKHVQQISLPQNIDFSRLEKQVRNQIVTYHIPKK